MSGLQYTFTLKSESRRGKAARLVEDNVDLAFEDLEEAMKWRQAIDAQVLCCLIVYAVQPCLKVDLESKVDSAAIQPP